MFVLLLLFGISTSIRAWKYYPVDGSVQCANGHNAPIFSAVSPTTTVVHNTQWIFPAVGQNGMSVNAHLGLVNQFGVFEGSSFPVENTDLLEVMRVVPPDWRDLGDQQFIPWTEDGVETEFVWFWHAPGSGVFINTSGMNILQLIWHANEEYDLIKSATRNNTVVIRLLNPSVEIIMRANSWDEPTACPDVPFTCDCVAAYGMLSSCPSLVPSITRVSTDWCYETSKDLTYQSIVLLSMLALALLSWIVSRPWLMLLRATKKNNMGLFPSLHQSKFLMVGFFIWWPANAIGDGMPLAVSIGGDLTIVSKCVFAMTIGNLAALLPLRQFKETSVIKFVRCVGLIALPLALIGPYGLITAALLAGICGAIGTAVVWGYVVHFDDTAVKFVGVGMTLSAIMSSAIIFMTSEYWVYISVCSIIQLILIMTVSVKQSQTPLNLYDDSDDDIISLKGGANLDSDTELILLEYSEKAGNPPVLSIPLSTTPKCVTANHLLYSLFYVTGYLLPTLLPYVTTNNNTYKILIAIGTIGDIVGRIVTARETGIVMTALVVCTLTTTSFIVITLTQATYVAATFVFYLLRGTAVTSLQLDVKFLTPNRSKLMGRYSQMGALVGSLSALLLVHLFSLPLISD
jgi:hypothetical protein